MAVKMTQGTPAKATASAVGSTSAPTKTASPAGFAVIPEMTVSSTILSGRARIDFSCAFDVQNADSFEVALFLDGVEISGSRRHVQYTSAFLALITPGSIPGYNLAISWTLTDLSPAAHTFDARWSRTGGTARAITTQRSITVVEL